jgi:hypothetical protein
VRSPMSPPFPSSFSQTSFLNCFTDTRRDATFSEGCLATRSCQEERSATSRSYTSGLFMAPRNSLRFSLSQFHSSSVMRTSLASASLKPSGFP